MSVNIGDKFGKLTVLKLQDEIRNQKLEIKRTTLCLCDCGIHLIVEKYNLSSGNTKQCNSCAVFTRGNKIHGHSNPLKKDTKEYKTYMSWKAMIQRCYNEKDSHYERYGGRGIKMCDRWLDGYSNYLDDMGLIPEFGLQIDRVDNNKNYCKDNCKWSTRKEQANNKSTNRKITAFGKTQNLQQWADELGIKRETIARRLNSGYSPDEALSAKDRIYKKQYKNPKGTFNTLKEAGEVYGLKTSATHSRFKSDKYLEWVTI